MSTEPCQRPVDTAVACHYADDPASRPRCALTAVVRYGPVPLCRSCQDRRSTLGKGHPPVILTSPELDVLDWIDAAHRQASAAERTLAAAIARGRQTGHTWTAIGARLGISRQAAQQRYARSQATPAARIRS